MESPSFYIIGTKYDKSDDVLPDMLREGVISTGFAGNLDLSPIVGCGFAKTKEWLETKIPKESGVAKNTLARFVNIKPGDIVALKSHSAPSNTQPRLVIARYAVVKGSDFPIYARSDTLGHTLKVDFLDDQEPIELSLGYGQTLHYIEDDDLIDRIFGVYGDIARNRATEESNKDERPTHNTEIEARGPYIMKRTHNILQNELRHRLEGEYGKDRVTQEADYVDLKVSLDDLTLLFEVKSSPSPISCIREALGQVLHYSWKLGIPKSRAIYVVVGPSPRTEDGNSFGEYVMDASHALLMYCTPDNFPTMDTVRQLVQHSDEVSSP